MDAEKINNAIELRDVTYCYDKGTPHEKKALSHVSVGFKKGRITGIMGHTGSGKSTLATLLNGLTKCQEGQILHNGKDIWENKKEIRQLRFEVGLVFQYPEYQLFEESVRADIAYGPKNMGKSDEEIAALVDEAARFTGIDKDVLDRSPFDLSGGQKRRVAIAGVLAMAPDTLVLDEPAAGLDPTGREEILSGLVRYNKEKGATLIIISHSMEDMAKYCDDLVVLKDGELKLCGTVEEVFSHADELISWGLNVPQITKLAKLLRDKGMKISDGIFTVDALASELCTGGERK